MPIFCLPEVLYSYRFGREGLRAMGAANLLRQGLLIISVDLEPSVDQLRVSQSRSLETVTGELLKVFAQHDIAASWAVADPVHSAATERILSAQQPHEIAVLGDSTWVGSRAGRGRFSKELARRVQGARAAGMSVSTLIPSGVTLDDHLDLLVKNEITAVRGQVDSEGHARAAAQPHALHFGLWEFPGSLSLPGRSRWLPGGGGAPKVRRGLAASGVFHLIVDAPRLAQGGAAANRVLDRALYRASQHRQRQGLKILTLGGAARQLCETRATVPARSVLRPAG